jgi:uncharacterized OB-fold protein
MPTPRCSHCGELVSPEHDYCVGCGTPIPDHGLPLERRVRALIIVSLVLGAAVILGSLVRDWLASG